MGFDYTTRRPSSRTVIEPPDTTVSKWGTSKTPTEKAFPNGPKGTAQQQTAKRSSATSSSPAREEEVLSLASLTRYKGIACDLARDQKIYIGLPSPSLRVLQQAMQRQSILEHRVQKITGANVLAHYAELFPMLEVQMPRGILAQNYLAALEQSPIPLLAFRIIFERFSEMQALIKGEQWKIFFTMLSESSLLSRSMLLLTLRQTIPCFESSATNLWKLLDHLEEQSVFLEIEHWSWKREKELAGKLGSYAASFVEWDAPQLPGVLSVKPEITRITSSRHKAWLRMLGRNAEEWMQDTKYNYCYNSRELKHVSMKAASLRAEHSTMVITGATVPYAHSFRSALELAQLLRQQSLASDG